MSTPKTFHQLAQEWREEANDARLTAPMLAMWIDSKAKQLEALIREWHKTIAMLPEGYRDGFYKIVGKLGGAEKP